MTTPKAPISRHLIDATFDWRTICELLKAEQYEQVAKLLLEAQATSQQSQNVMLADVFSAAYYLCLACEHCRAEVAWLEQAREAADQRACQLSQLLYAISRQFREHGVPELLTGPAAALEPDQGESGLASLTVYCLGSFRVYLDDQLITDWSGGKGKSIFKYMVANRTHAIAKEVLMELFWPETDPEAARNNLNVAIYSLRQAFRKVRPDYSLILFQDDHYLLNPAITVWVDFERFLQSYQAGRGFEKQGQVAEAIREYELAEALYQGDFLEEDLYEDWPILQRESLKDRYLVILERLSRYYLEQQRYTTAIHLCQKILAKDDCREDAHRRLMRCYSRRGQPHLALRQYHLCVEALTRVLDVSPTPETVALYHQIRHRESV